MVNVVPTKAVAMPKTSSSTRTRSTRRGASMIAKLVPFSECGRPPSWSARSLRRAESGLPMRADIAPREAPLLLKSSFAGGLRER